MNYEKLKEDCGHIFHCIRDEDMLAAWEIHVELSSRIVTQPLDLSAGRGDDKSALDSIHAIFEIVREILKKHFKCSVTAFIAYNMLTSHLRPFCGKWHKLSMTGAFSDEEKCNEFREELKELQEIINDTYLCLFYDIVTDDI